MKIVVAGSASSFARALFAFLLEDPDVEQIVAVDAQESSFADPRFAQVLLDLRSPQLARVVAGADAVINLTAAGSFDRPAAGPRERARRRGLDLEGAQNVFRAAAERRVPRVVHLSSAVVYALPARRGRISEAHPRGSPPGLDWAEDLIKLEEWLDDFEPAHPDLRVVRLRPHLIVGRAGPWWVRRLLRALIAVRAPVRPPRVQCVHVGDVAAAIRNALRHDTAGAFNLACRNALPLPRIQGLAGRGWISLSYPLAYRLRAAAWRLGLGTEPAWLERLRHEVVLDTGRARRLLGWKPRYDTIQACLKAAE